MVWIVPVSESLAHDIEKLLKNSRVAALSASSSASVSPSLQADKAPKTGGASSLALPAAGSAGPAHAGPVGGHRASLFSSASGALAAVQTPPQRRGSSGGNDSPAAPLTELQRSQKAEEEALKALDFYRKALEEQITRAKQNALKHTLAATDRPSSQLSAQNKHLQQLAQSYMEAIIDKDVQMDHQKKVIRVLGNRVQELESAFAAADRPVPEAAPLPTAHDA